MRSLEGGKTFSITEQQQRKRITVYFTFGTKHYASAINNKFRPGVVNVTSPSNQKVNVIPYDSEPRG